MFANLGSLTPKILNSDAGLNGHHFLQLSTIRTNYGGCPKSKLSKITKVPTT